mmetsp:Transcript_36859/g.84984  ORF Transcript_36859/g.84984 Transcript_36859/m.84984 type:complete len:207 (+) Transcript_36859:2835-3455(+)
MPAGFELQTSPSSPSCSGQDVFGSRVECGKQQPGVVVRPAHGDGLWQHFQSWKPMRALMRWCDVHHGTSQDEALHRAYPSAVPMLARPAAVANISARQPQPISGMITVAAPSTSSSGFEFAWQLLLSDALVNERLLLSISPECAKQPGDDASLSACCKTTSRRLPMCQQPARLCNDGLCIFYFAAPLGWQPRQASSCGASSGTPKP